MQSWCMTSVASMLTVCFMSYHSSPSTHVISCSMMSFKLIDEPQWHWTRGWISFSASRKRHRSADWHVKIVTLNLTVVPTLPVWNMLHRQGSRYSSRCLLIPWIPKPKPTFLYPTLGPFSQTSLHISCSHLSHPSIVQRTLRMCKFHLMGSCQWHGCIKSETHQDPVTFADAP